MIDDNEYLLTAAAAVAAVVAAVVAGRHNFPHFGLSKHVIKLR